MTFLKRRKGLDFSVSWICYLLGGGGGKVPKHLYILEFVLDVSFLCYTNPQEFKNVLPKPSVFLKGWDWKCGTQLSQAQISPLQSVTSVTLSKLLNLSAPQFLHLQNRGPNGSVIVKMK